MKNQNETWETIAVIDYKLPINREILTDMATMGKGLMQNLIGFDSIITRNQTLDSLKELMESIEKQIEVVNVEQWKD